MSDESRHAHRDIWTGPPANIRQPADGESAMPWQTDLWPRHIGPDLNRRRHDMEKTLVIAGLKGGVGKTTTALSLASTWAMEGRRVVLLDLDPQASASLAAGQQPAADPLRADPIAVDMPGSRGTLELLAGGRTLDRAREGDRAASGPCRAGRGAGRRRHSSDPLTANRSGPPVCGHRDRPHRVHPPIHPVSAGSGGRHRGSG